MDEASGVSIGVLGPMSVRVDQVVSDLPSRRQRALLAALVVGGGTPVSVTDLVDAVWDEDPPERARTTLQTYVSRLRRLLGQETIAHSPAGYHLGANVTTDLAEVRRTVAELDPLDRDDQRVGDLAERALTAWRGPALSEFADVEWFWPIIVELGEMRANLIDLTAGGMIGSQRCPQAVALLESSVATDPLREPTQILLVRALHGAGRTTEAVRAASRYRRSLRDTTGLVPGADFAAVEHLVLTIDDPPPPSPNGVDGGEEPVPSGAAPHTEAPRRPRPDWSSVRLRRPTPLIGRTDQLDELQTSLDTCRLVTLLGTGGVGKTRLAAEFADRLAATTTVLSIELAAVEPDRVLATIGAVLGIRDESVDANRVAEVIGQEDVVLVVDNAEHVLGAVRDLVEQLLARCPNARILVTSRERLAVNAEVVVPVEPLGVEGPNADAVTLFLDRLRRARPHSDLDTDDDGTVAEICRRLDGIPLALELAASRAATLGVPALRGRFDSMLGQLYAVDAGQHRHSTLGNVVEWSIELLGPQAQALLTALGVFRSDFTIEAAESVGSAIGADDVSVIFGRLVATSLVATGSRPGTFRLLEMIRHVSRQRLAVSEYLADVRRAHAEWVAVQLGHIDVDSVGPSEDATTGRLDAMRDELLAALAWSLDSGSIVVAAPIVTALIGPLLYRPDNELIAAVRGVGDHRAIVGSPSEPAMLAADARAAFLLGDLDDVPVLAERAARLVADDDLTTRHRAEHALGVYLLYRGEFDAAQATFRPIVDDEETAVVQHLDALGGLALALTYSGDTSAALAAAHRLRAMAETLRSDTYVAFADYALAEIDITADEVDAAVQLLGEAADRAWRTQARFVWGVASTVLARVLVRHRPPADARAQLPALVERWQRTATWPQLWTTLRLGAEHLAATDDPRTALLILEAADRDAAAPSLSDDDRALHGAIREQIRAATGEAAAGGISDAALAIDRLEVVARARRSLDQPLGS